jgi:hypothetical protein
LSFETGFCYTAPAGLEFVVFLSQPPECWDCRYASPYLTTTLFPFQQLEYFRKFVSYLTNKKL